MAARQAAREAKPKCDTCGKDMVEERTNLWVCEDESIHQMPPESEESANG